MKKRINYTLFFLLIISVYSIEKGFSQKSIFETDTIYLKFYSYSLMGDQAQHLSSLYKHYNKTIEEKWGFSIQYGKYNDTTLVGSIFLDSNKYVHWNIMQLYVHLDTLGNINWDQYRSTLGNELIKTRIPDSKLEELIPKGKRTYVPLFKAFIKDNKIYYEAEINGKYRTPLILSFSPSDTFSLVPYFFNSLNNNNVSNYYDIKYSGDTTVYYARKNAYIDCYKFVTQAITMDVDMSTYNLIYTEMLFEKISLLPVKLYTINAYRRYLYVDIDNKYTDNRLRYFSNYQVYVNELY